MLRMEVNVIAEEGIDEVLAVVVAFLVDYGEVFVPVCLQSLLELNEHEFIEVLID